MSKPIIRKALLITMLFIIVCSVSNAQQRDVVYLKNGSVIKGKIIEFVPDKEIKIETADGSVFVFKSSELVKIEKETSETNEIEKSKNEEENKNNPLVNTTTQTTGRRLRTLSDVQKDNKPDKTANPDRKQTLNRYNKASKNEDINLSDYNSSTAVGLAIGGGGILGATYRFFPSEKIGLEIGAFLRPTYYQTETYYYNYYYDSFENSTDNTYTVSAMLTVGPVVYFNSSINRKGKIKKNGMSFKAGISPFGEINELMGAVNWVHDTFKPQNKNRYFSFELGLGALYMYDKPYGLANFGYLGSDSDFSPVLYWKVNWFWSL